jgi:hypothetical protein
MPASRRSSTGSSAPVATFRQAADDPQPIVAADDQAGSDGEAARSCSPTRLNPSAVSPLNVRMVDVAVETLREVDVIALSRRVDGARTRRRSVEPAEARQQPVGPS